MRNLFYNFFGSPLLVGVKNLKKGLISTLIICEPLFNLIHIWNGK